MQRIIEQTYVCCTMFVMSKIIPWNDLAEPEAEIVVQSLISPCLNLAEPIQSQLQITRLCHSAQVTDVFIRVRYDFGRE